MRDVNAVKKASSDTSRASNCFNRAVDSFWPDKAARMKTLLLEIPDSSDSATLKSSSEYEEVVSFRQLVTGAICAWQECWSLLQTVKHKTFNRESHVDHTIESLNKLKTDLIGEIDRRHYSQVVLCIFSLQAIYLHLQARRMRTFIRNPRLQETLARICSLDPLVYYTSVDQLESTNDSLRSNFNIYQRDNVDDFLLHLEVYFQPEMKDFLEKKKWLICEQGRSAAMKC